MTKLVACMAVVGVMSCSASHEPAPAPSPTMTFQQTSDAALQTLQNVFYDDGNWNTCAPTPCSSILPSDDFDWGADSLTAALTLRWSIAGDAAIPPMMTRLAANAATYGTCSASDCPSWSDVPLWDSIAASHEHLIIGTDETLQHAQQAFDYVDTAAQFALGACPDIDYQLPSGGDNHLKTLETDSNYIKAALLLYQITGTATYLTKAQTKYASARKYFLDPSVPLYTVFVLDDGQSCSQIPARFYASVNGNMIWNGIALAAATSTSSYLDDAMATGQAVTQYLVDANGVFADLQTDDDVVEPLVEAMNRLATEQNQTFASDWLKTNATAMAAARTSFGAYGRFFDGPAPQGQVSEWQANGGLALAFVAGGLWPTEIATTKADAWQSAVYVADDLSTLPSSIQFTGQAIAVFGTMGEGSYQLGQASVLVDGTETFDQTGIHQNESNALGRIDNAILFAWRWPTSGRHTLTFQAGPSDPKNGGPFLHVQGYSYVP
ncbi:MAG: hypothetical protein ACRELY_25575 [Polyangiaceae bacterium]